MAMLHTPALTCAECGSRPVAGTFKRQAYCISCVEPLLLDPTGTFAEAVALLERLATAGREAEDASGSSLGRQVTKVQRMGHQLTHALQASISGGVTDPAELCELHGDHVLQHQLDRFVIDADIRTALTLAFWGDGEWGDLAMACEEGWSVLAFIEHAMFSHGAREATDELLFRHLLSLPYDYSLSHEDNGRISLQELQREPWRSRLATLQLSHVVLGLGRMAELSRHLAAGELPPERFSERERLLYLEIESEGRRRMARAWHSLGELARGGLSGREDRAEQLVRCWITFPMSGPIVQYLQMVWRAYVAGHYSEALILCRAILERAVDAALPPMPTGSPKGKKGPLSMRDKLAHLEETGHLSSALKVDAGEVWHRGNRTVHKNPLEYAKPEQVLETIQYALAVATALQQPPANNDNRTGRRN